MLRKTTVLMPDPVRADIASMRPQRNAAENGPPTYASPAPPRASMRPQRNAAENSWALLDDASRGDASMRPQRNAAENLASPRGASVRAISLQ